jgi:CheY-like chemotaxis protein
LNETPPKTTAPEPLRILWVDDQPYRVEPWVESLREAGAEVVEASSPKVALDLYASGAKFGLMILDVMMPPTGLSPMQTDYGRLTGGRLLQTLRDRGYSGPALLFTNGRILEDLKPFMDEHTKAARKIDQPADKLPGWLTKAWGLKLGGPPE